jgi:hypothetical protein
MSPNLGLEHEAQSFILRVRLVSIGGEPRQFAPRLRLEHVNERTVWQFTEIGTALAQLKVSLEAIVFGPAA